MNKIFISHSSRNKEFIKRLKKLSTKSKYLFDNFFIKSKLVEAVKLSKEEGLKHYSYDDLKKWEEHWKRPVLYKLTGKGKKWLTKWEDIDIHFGDTITLTV
jgi:hypothetical protein